MRLRILILVGTLTLLATAPALAQQSSPAPATTIPAAHPSEMECSGFITTAPVSTDLYVFDGVDNEFRNPYHMWKTGDSVYLRSRGSGRFAVGNEYAIVRSAKELMRVRWYDGQGGALRSLGTAYEDVGRVKVLRVTPQGAIAEVTFACGPIRAEDLATTRQPRPIPQFTPSGTSDRYIPPNKKLTGAITAGVGNAVYLSAGSMAYVNLGLGDGAAPGQKYRIFHIMRETVSWGLLLPPEPPREIIGEMVILSTQENSSVGMVVKSTREIVLGDGIEQE